MITRRLCVCMLSFLSLPCVGQVHPQMALQSPIDHRAEQITNPNESEIKELTQVVMTKHHIVGPLADVAQPITNMISTAQVSYLSQQTGGVTEVALVRSLNKLATFVGAPAYASTSTEELRNLRVRLFLVEPHFIGMGPRRPTLKSKSSKFSSTILSGEMSPLEAFHVAATMIEQKMFNPEFQALPAEKQIALKEGRENPLTPEESRVRFEQMRRVVESTTSRHSIMDVFQAAVEAIGTLAPQKGSAR